METMAIHLTRNKRLELFNIFRFFQVRNKLTIRKGGCKKIDGREKRLLQKGKHNEDRIYGQQLLLQNSDRQL